MRLLQRINVQVLINVAAANSHHLNNTPLLIHASARLTCRFYLIWQKETSRSWKLKPKQENIIESCEGNQKQHIWEDISIVNSAGMDNPTPADA